MDYGHEQSDKMLKTLEGRLVKNYRAASASLKKKVKDATEKFTKQDKEKKELLKKGKLSQDEYDKWRERSLSEILYKKDLYDSLVQDMTNANKIAADLINDKTPDVYALNANYGAFEICKGVDANLSFSLYDHATVERLVRDDPEIIPKAKVDIPKDKRWNRQKLTSAITQGILTGESIPDIARRLGGVAEMNLSAAVRNARTYTTAAENGGRVDSYKRAEAMGITLKQEWMATLDMRTRSSHRHLDGEKIKVGGKFSNGCRYPGDPDGPPWEIYNCRCTLVASDPLFEDEDSKALAHRFSRLPAGVTYEEWKNEKEQGAKQALAHKVVDGKDISGIWKWKPDQFDFAIDDVISAQGFDGLPRILSGKEFDDAVKAANGGNGFIAQRTYSAPNQEILDAYREQLYGGKWYVDCSTGGTTFGQGMYCAADYTGTLSDGIKSEMRTYKGIYDTKYGTPDNEQVSRAVLEQVKRDEEDAIKYGGNFGEDERNEREQYWTGKISKLSADVIEERYGISGNNMIAPNYVETLTLDPSAKIISYDDLVKRSQEPDAWDIMSNGKTTDMGVFAAQLGYDAINGMGTEVSGSYTVILNRTKLIIKGD